MISSLSTEPQPNQELIHYAFRYLVYSHSQLSYVSALGHQRTQIQDQHILALLDQSVELLKHALTQQQPIPHQQIEDMLIKIQHLSSQGQVSEQNQLLLKQISLLLETLTELVMLKNKLLELEIR